MKKAAFCWKKSSKFNKVPLPLQGLWKKYWEFLLGIKSVVFRKSRPSKLAKKVFLDFDKVKTPPHPLKLLKLSEICQLETGKFEFKSQRGLLPVQIGNYFEDSSSQEIHHSYGLRSRSRNDAPPRFLSESKTGEKSLQFRKSQLWNTLSTEIKNCETFMIFKKTYKNFLPHSEEEEP